MMDSLTTGVVIAKVSSSAKNIWRISFNLLDNVRRSTYLHESRCLLRRKGRQMFATPTNRCPLVDKYQNRARIGRYRRYSQSIDSVRRPPTHTKPARASQSSTSIVGPLFNFATKRKTTARAAKDARAILTRINSQPLTFGVIGDGAIFEDAKWRSMLD